MTIETLTAFFGWCTVINVGIMIFSVIMLIVMQDFASRLHAKMFGLNPEDLKLIYFKYLSYYKIAIIVFNLTPYLALKLMQLS